MFLKFATQKKSWISLALICIFLNISALFIQYFYNIEPCVICVQQRALLFLISIITFLGIPFRLKKASLIFILIDILIFAKIILLSVKKIHIQLHPYESTSCLIEKPFPSFIPLDKLIPSIFLNKGYCSSSDINILGFSLSQILITICIIIFIYLISYLFSFFYNIRK